MKFVDMAMSPEEAAEEYASPTPSGKLPKYPYGLCISLCKDELDKLGMDCGDCEVGDMLHLHALAKVTSYSVRETEAGPEPRVELVLAFLEVEDEDEENEVEDKNVLDKMYKK